MRAPKEEDRYLNFQLVIEEATNNMHQSQATYKRCEHDAYLLYAFRRDPQA